MKRIFLLSTVLVMCSVLSVGTFAVNTATTETPSAIQTVSKSTETSKNTSLGTTAVETTEKNKEMPKSQIKTETEKETETDSSQPRLMVIKYEVENDGVTPNGISKVKVTFKNQSKTKAVNNIKLSLSDESGELKPDGMGTQYVGCIYAGDTYVWEFGLCASHTATVGEHSLTVAMEYEDKNYVSYTASDTLRITVRQTVSLDYSGIQLPLKVTQDETVTVDINLMNTGKTDLANCKIDFEIDGMQSGGTSFVGEIPAGENKTATVNLRVDGDALGEISGKAVISYLDAYGKSHTKTVDVSATVLKKTVTEKTEEKETEKKNPQWWAFLLGGLAVGGGVGFAVPTAINSAKQRKEDEKRL